MIMAGFDLRWEEDWKGCFGYLIWVEDTGLVILICELGFGNGQQMLGYWLIEG